MQFNLQADRGDPMERCRLCACHCSPANKVDIFSEEGRTRALEEKMRACLPLESQVMLVADRLPRSVCCQCVALLERFHTFRLDCISASALLRKCLEQYNARPPAQQGGALQQQLEGLQHQMRRSSKGRSDSMPTLEPQIPALRRSSEVIELTDEPAAPSPQTVIELSDDESEPVCGSTTSLLKATLLRSNHGQAEELARPNGDEGCNGVSRRKNARPRKIARAREDDEEPEVEESEVVTMPVVGLLCCVLCEKNFATKSGLSRHLNACHGIDMADVEVRAPRTPGDGPQTVAPCELCPRSFTDRQSLWLHIRHAHRREAALACGLCLRISVSTDELSRHWRSHRSEGDRPSLERRYSCSVCGRQDNSRKKLTNHVRVHGLDPSLQPDSLVLVNAELYAGDNDYFPCDLCSKAFESEEALTKHTQNVHNSHRSRPECDVCFAVFRSQSSLEEHRVSCHRSDEDVLYCKYCSRQFAAMSGLEAHQRRCKNVSSSAQEAVLSHHCEVCRKAFTSEDCLVKHKKGAHRGGEGGAYQAFYFCEVCASSHATKIDRWVHVSSAHPKEESIRCPVATCGKVFSSEGLAFEHRSHHAAQGSCPNTCEVCGRLSESRVEFWKHVQGVHAAMLPLVCGVCLKMFVEAADLIAHVRDRHARQRTEGFRCRVCARQYSNRAKCARHEMIHGEELLASMSASQAKKRRVEGPDKLVVSSQAAVRVTRPLPALTRVTRPSQVVSKAPQPVTNTSRVAKGVQSIARVVKPPQMVPKLVTNASKVPKPPQTATNTSKEPLACDVCPSLGDFDSPSSLACHRRSAHRLHPCDLCPKFYGRNSHLWKHVSRKHRGHPLVTCPECDKVSATANQLAAHSAKLHRAESRAHILSIPSFVVPGRGYRCVVCERRFPRRLALRRHQRRCRNKKSVPVSEPKTLVGSEPKTVSEPGGSAHRCPLCGEVSLNAKSLLVHLQGCHREQAHLVCGQCYQLHKDTLSLASHVQDRHKEVSQQRNACRVCARTYCSAYRAGEHAVRAHKACAHCAMVFASAGELSAHREACHGVKGGAMVREGKAEPPAKRARRSYDCERCAMSFSQPSYLEGHRRRQHAIKLEREEDDGEEVEGENDEEGEDTRAKRAPNPRRTLDESILRLTSTRKGEESAMPSLTNEREAASATANQGEMPTLELHTEETRAIEMTGGEADQASRGLKLGEESSREAEEVEPGEESSREVEVIEESNREEVIEESSREEEKVIGESSREEEKVEVIEESSREEVIEEKVEVIEESSREKEKVEVIEESSREAETMEVVDEVEVEPKVLEPTEQEPVTKPSTDIERTEVRARHGDTDKATPSPPPVCVGEGGDCLNSLEDALDILEAQNS